MKELVVIRLNSNPQQPIHWLVWAEQTQQIIASGTLQNVAELSGIAMHCKDRAVKILVPSSDVVTKQVSLPGKLTRKLTQALPYMMEESLAQDIEELHTVVLNSGLLPDESHYAEVAVVSHDLMQQWIDALSDADIKADFFAIDALCLPLFNEAEKTVAQLDGDWLVRESDYHAVQVDNAWLPLYLQQLIDQSTDTKNDDSSDTEQTNGVVFNSYDHQFEVAVDNASLNMDVLRIVSQPAELTMQLMAQGVQKLDQARCNLLQGQYKQSNDNLAHLKKWRNLGVAASILFVVLLLEKGMSIYQSNQLIEEQQKLLVATYSKAFPKERVRESLIRKQLRQKLKQVGGDTSSDVSFIAQLNEVITVFGAESGLVPESIKFDKKRNEIRFSGSASDFQTFEKIKSQLEQKGLSVSQGALNNEGDAVIGSFIVRSQS